ncbi:MAG: hypothetical protein JNM17_30720 [Archangium sp.]|nr:hypothetical protein [Archangium sp.]
MTLSRATVSNRAAAVRSALLKADVNRDGKLSAAEQRRATNALTGANDVAVREAYKQARMRSGFVSVSKARGLVNLALSRALAADGNRNGVSATERARLSGPIARALTRGATGGTTGPKPTGNIGTFGPKAKRLAEAARRQARLMNTRGWCARGVNRALRAAGLYVSPLPSAYMYAKKLSGDSRFREIHGLSKAQLTKLPPGAIAVFEGYTGGRSKHGHIFVSLGNGLEASDHIQRIATHGRFRVFVPKG